MNEQKSTSCPNCGSEQINITKKPLRGKRGIAGAIATRGAVALSGRFKSNDLSAVCTSCNKSWEPDRAYRSEQTRIYKIWKAEIFHHYEDGNFDEAARIFLTKRKFSSKWPDIHSVCYGKKNVDRMRSVIKVGMFIVILIIIYSVFFHRNHLISDIIFM
jgi:predicted RNA-binding Zn-ribbon protein involved in translation (DUF1610 family)